MNSKQLILLNIKVSIRIKIIAAATVHATSIIYLSHLQISKKTCDRCIFSLNVVYLPN
jgi:hypothetical protein